jgi:putative ATP-dependent endonuclease of the OLD family
MTSAPNSRSYLAKLKVCNLGCIGPEGIEVELDDIVCLVGANNSGKSTVLRAYEAAAMNAKLSPSETSVKANGAPTTVELWVHIPQGTENIDEKWKEPVNGMLLVRSKWSWPAGGGDPVRTTWDPEIGDYAEDGKASGLDTVFKSRLPKPFRIGSLDDPEEEHKKLLELVLEPIKSRIVELMKDEGSDLRSRIRDLQAEAEKPVAAFKADLDTVQSRVNTSYRRVFSSAQIQANSRWIQGRLS